jgi:hypothetical protein
MLSASQIEKIPLLSDTILYPEAVAFIRRMVRDEDCLPLPTSQVMGLLNVAKAFKYSELYEYIKHQRDRSWPTSKSDIKKLYTDLEQLLTLMKNKRLKDDFHLTTEDLNPMETRQESDELMAQLAHDFIQHLVAENGMLASSQSKEYANTWKKGVKS